MAFQAMAWALQQDVTPTQKLVLIALANFADQKGHCFPSSKALARITGLCERTVGYALEILSDKKHRLIEKESTFSEKNGRQLANRFKLVAWMMEGRTSQQNRGCTGCAPCTRTQKEKNQSEESTESLVPSENMNPMRVQELNDCQKTPERSPTNVKAEFLDDEEDDSWWTGKRREPPGTQESARALPGAVSIFGSAGDEELCGMRKPPARNVVIDRLMRRLEGAGR